MILLALLLDLVSPALAIQVDTGTAILLVLCGHIGHIWCKPVISTVS